MPPKDSSASKTSSKRAKKDLSEMPPPPPPSPENENEDESPHTIEEDITIDKDTLKKLVIEVAELRTMLEGHIQASVSGGANATKEAPKRAKTDTQYSWHLHRIVIDDEYITALWKGNNKDIWPYDALEPIYLDQFKNLPETNTDNEGRLKLGRNLWSKCIKKEQRHAIDDYREKVDPKPAKAKKGSKKAGKPLPENLMVDYQGDKDKEESPTKKPAAKKSKPAPKKAASKPAPKKTTFSDDEDTDGEESFDSKSEE